MTRLKVAASNTITIDKGVPFKRRGHHRTKYPFRDMEVGDSFLFPAGHHDTHYYGMSREFTKQTTVEGARKVFKTRKTPEGHRCWRVE